MWISDLIQMDDSTQMAVVVMRLYIGLVLVGWLNNHWTLV